MPINNNWYNLNATRVYPVDDAATWLTDDGVLAPMDILADCHIVFPRTVGRYLFVSGLSVTSRLVSAVFLAAEDQDAADGFYPLAAVSLPQPVSPFKQYAVQALSPGVGGFVAFQDVTEPFAGKFSTPAQSRLAPRCSRAYKPLPIPNIRKRGRAEGLEGLVNILAGSDLEIVAETVEIGGVDRDAIVIRLKQGITGRNVLSEYIGPCGHRPESRNCSKEAVETINGVGPDCAGNINILFDGVVVGTGENCGFEVYDHSLGLPDVCAAQAAIDVVIARDLCESSVSSASSASSASSGGSAGPSPSSSSAAPTPCEELPYCESFDTYTAAFFDVVEGTFGFTTGDSPAESCPSAASSVSCPSGEPDCDTDVSYTALSAAQRNIAVWDACAYGSSLEKRIKTDIRFGTTSAQRNGGIVVNYHLVDPLSNPHIEYFIVVLDQLRQTLRLRRVSGLGISTVHEVALAEVASLDHWYHMRVDVQENPGDASQTIITASVGGVTDPGWASTSFSVATNRFLPDDGLYGLGSDRSVTQFSYFTIEELP